MFARYWAIKLLTVAVPASLCTSGASSQELRPLSDAIVSGAEDTYPLVRCAAVRFAILSRAGPNSFPEDFVTRATDEVSKLMAMAVGIRVSKGSGATATQKVVLDEMLAIAGLYLTRMNQNYTISGHAFAEDSLIGGDLDTCKLLIDTIKQQ